MILSRLVALAAATAFSAGSAAALPPAEKCETGKLKQAGMYGFCRLKAEAKAVKTGDPPDYSKCAAAFGSKWTDLESEGGGMCPTNGDQAAIGLFISEHTDDVATALSAGGLAGRGQRLQTGQISCRDSAGTLIACAGTGHDGELQKGLAVSFTDNGDGTISDNQTGLMWEKLSDDGSIHDKDDAYDWAEAFTMKIASLNATMFAGYDDWRLPNVNELQGIANYSEVFPAVHPPFDTGCVAGCTVTACSCTGAVGGYSVYWSSTSYAYSAGQIRAYVVDFAVPYIDAYTKMSTEYVRAVRGGT